MGLTRRVRLALGAAALLAAAAAADGLHWWRLERWNAVIAASQPGTGQPGINQPGIGQPGADQPAADQPDAPAPVRLARALALAADGHADAALNRYRALQDDASVGQAARYNGANLLMRQAAEVRAGAQPGQAIPLIELAKEAYREVLRRDPLHWDARYNLERAQRLLPDPDTAEAPPAELQRDAERAATTMRGFSMGLP